MTTFTQLEFGKFSAPIPFRLALHCRRFRVLDLHPMRENGQGPMSGSASARSVFSRSNDYKLLAGRGDVLAGDEGEEEFLGKLP